MECGSHDGSGATGGRKSIEVFRADSSAHPERYLRKPLSKLPNQAEVDASPGSHPAYIEQQKRGHAGLTGQHRQFERRRCGARRKAPMPDRNSFPQIQAEYHRLPPQGSRDRAEILE